MQKIDIAVIGGYASTNVGNSYFRKGLQYALFAANPDRRIVITQSLPGYYWKEKRTNPKNSFNYISRLDAEYLVITGPLFDTKFPALWSSTLNALKKRGTRIMFMSAGSQKYDDKERETVRAFLEKVEPYALVSRDSPTYQAYHDLAEHSYDGIDFAFFLGDLYEPYRLEMEEYVILNFDTSPEPRFRQERSGEGSFTFLGEEWSYKQVNMDRVRRKIFWYFPVSYRYFNRQFGRYAIVRPFNYVNPGTHPRLFSLPETYVSELTHDHINLYANACGTLSCRVHSCLASLVFGKEAMLFSNTKRGKLFDRVGLGQIREHPVRLDMDYIADEKRKQLEFLKGIL